MRKDLNFYEKFQKLRELIVGLPFGEEVSIERRHEAFFSLVDLLVKKGVYKNDGSIQKWRENSIQYLRDVIDSLEESDLQQVLDDQEVFFQRFIFTPSGKSTSLYAALKQKGVRMAAQSFWNVPLESLYGYFRERTGKSAFEKVPTIVAQNFLLEVESFG